MKMNETNLTDLNLSIMDKIDLNEITSYFSFLSKTLTGKVVEFLSNQGISVSVRWASLLLFFVSLGLIFIGMKIGQKIIKIILIILGITLLLGTIIPW